MTMAYVPGLAGVPATESSISYIDGQAGVLTYRGYSIAELALHSSFEETSLLLLTGELPSAAELTRFKCKLGENRRVKYNIRSLMKCLPATTHPMHMLQTVMASMASFYPLLPIWLAMKMMQPIFGKFPRIFLHTWVRW